MSEQPKTDKSIPDPDFLFFVTREQLTDGSHVYNVICGEMKFAAEDEEHALQLADEMAAAINDHTVHIADVIREF